MLVPKMVTSQSSLINLCDSPSPSFSSLETAELVRTSPLSVDASHEVSISRVPNPNFIAPPVAKTIPSQPRLFSPTLNPTFSQPPRISTKVYTTLGFPTDNIPTVLHSHSWSSDHGFSSFTPSTQPCRCSVLGSTITNPLNSSHASLGFPFRHDPAWNSSRISSRPSVYPIWVNPYEPRPSFGSFNHCYQVTYTNNNPRIECAGFVNRYSYCLFNFQFPLKHKKIKTL